MAFTRYASVDASQVLSVKGSKTRVQDASLTKLADYSDFRTEDGYLYARIRAISSRVNKNHDGWPSIELAGGQDVFDAHRTAGAPGDLTIEAKRGAKYGFSTFLGKPIFVDHNNSDPTRSRGAIVDAKLHIEDQKTAALDPYYAAEHCDPEHKPCTWVELLLEVDAKAYPKFAKAIIDGANDSSTGIDGFSMGCNVERSVCNICKNSATTPEEFCSHVRQKGRNFQVTDHVGKRRSAKSYENCYGVGFFEISGVFDPADETALVREIRAGVRREADFPTHRYHADCPTCHGKTILSQGPPVKYCPTCTNGKFPRLDALGEGYTAPSASDTAANEDRVEVRHKLPITDPTDYLGPRRFGSTKTADNPVPQSELTMAPDHVDTLRQDESCPICGEALDEGSCDLCGYIEPPQGMNNPDLSRAQDVRDLPAQSGPDGAAQKILPPGGQPLPPPGMPTNPAQMQAPPPVPTNIGRPLARVKSDVQWTIVPHPRLAARINNAERPINPSNPISTNEPVETIVKDETTPVTSHVRTAGDILASVGRKQENNMERVAEGTSNDATAAPDLRTDVTGVGGIVDASPEQASKADGQVDVGAVGGTGVEAVDAKGHATVTETSDNGGFQQGGETGPPTTTWTGTDGNGVTKQLSPVGGKPFPASAEGVKKSHDDSPFPKDDGDISGGGAVRGVQPIAEQFGQRVDVLDPLTSPANNSGPTTTWSGTDGNGVLRQQDPTTREVATPWTSKVVSAVRLAELEIGLGLLPESEKWGRITELGTQSDERVATELAYAERVRTAGLKRTSKTVEQDTVRTAHKLPVLGRPTDMRTSLATLAPEDEPFGGTLFGI